MKVQISRYVNLFDSVMDTFTRIVGIDENSNFCFVNVRIFRFVGFCVFGMGIFDGGNLWNISEFKGLRKESRFCQFKVSVSGQ